jgi:hypothetical protein
LHPAGALAASAASATSAKPVAASKMPAKTTLFIIFTETLVAGAIGRRSRLCQSGARRSQLCETD